jgi:iron complex transport system substrate-binding protein
VNIRHLTPFILAFFFLSTCKGQGEKAAPVSVGASVLRDSDGAVMPSGPCRRIISLYSAHTENLFTLGAGSALIGGHKTCTWPPEAAALPLYDYSGDPEYAIAAEPDLVLIRPYIRRHSPEYVAELEKAGIQVVSLYAEGFEGFDGYIRKLAALVGVDPEPHLAAFHRELDSVAAKTAQIPGKDKRRVFFEATETAVRTVTEDSLPGLAIILAGGVNIAQGAKPAGSGSSIAAFGMEKVLEWGESIDVYLVQTGSMNPTDNLDRLGKRPGYHTIKAVREGKVLFINEKQISSPTFRYLSGVQELARFLYPALFP